MQYYYASAKRDNQLLLDENETRHITKTMRMKVGDILEVLDGKGSRYKGSISQISKKGLIVDITNVRLVPPPTQILHLLIAPTKNINRVEWLVEKATELAVAKITFIHTEHTERSRIRLDRLEKIAVSALKQSGNPFLPQLGVMTTFSDVVTAVQSDQKFIAHCQQNQLPMLRDIAEPVGSTAILIGPEGDFSMPEVELANSNGFRSVSLGKLRLRTETAGLYVSMLFANNDQDYD